MLSGNGSKAAPIYAAAPLDGVEGEPGQPHRRSGRNVWPPAFAVVAVRTGQGKPCRDTLTVSVGRDSRLSGPAHPRTLWYAALTAGGDPGAGLRHGLHPRHVHDHGRPGLRRLRYRSRQVTIPSHRNGLKFFVPPGRAGGRRTSRKFWKTPRKGAPAPPDSQGTDR